MTHDLTSTDSQHPHVQQCTIHLSLQSPLATPSKSSQSLSLKLHIFKAERDLCLCAGSGREKETLKNFLAIVFLKASNIIYNHKLLFKKNYIMDQAMDNVHHVSRLYLVVA